MARHFTRASSRRLEKASTPVTAAPLTIAAWVRADSFTSESMIASIDRSTSTFSTFTIGVTTGQKAIAEAGLGPATFGVATGTTSISASTWAHVCGVFTSSTSRAVFTNGGNKQTNSTSCTPASLDCLRIGCDMETNATNTEHWDGDIAEVAIWNVALTDDEVASLGNGISPLLIRPNALVVYAPLMSGNSPEVDLMSATGFTLTNSPTVSDHPRIIYPSGVILGKKVNTGSGQALAGTCSGTSSSSGDLAVAHDLASAGSAGTSSLVGVIGLPAPIALGSVTNTNTGAASVVPVGTTVPVGYTVLVMGINTSGVTGAASAADTDGVNVYTERFDVVGTPPSGSDLGMAMYDAPVTDAIESGDNITLTWDASNFSFRVAAAIAAQGISGTIQTQNTTDDVAFPQSSPDTGSTGPSVTTTTPDCLLIGIINHADKNTIRTYTPPSGWTELYDTGGFAVMYRVVTSTGTYNFSPVMSGTDYWRAAIFAYPASSGGTTQNLAGTCAGTSSCSASDLAVTHTLAGTGAGTGAASASDLAVTHTLTGSAAGAGALSAAGTATWALAGTGSGAGSLTGDLAVAHPLAGSAAGAGTVTADVLIGIPIAGTITGTGTLASAAVGVNRTIAGSAAGAGVLGNPDIRVTWSLVASAAGVGAASGDVRMAWAPAATVSASGTLVGALTGPIGLSGLIDVTSGLVGGLSVAYRLRHRPWLEDQLDDFNRANGALGGSWGGPVTTGQSSPAVSGNRAVC